MIIRAIAKTTLNEAFFDYMDFEAGEKQIHVNFDMCTSPVIAGIMKGEMTDILFNGEYVEDEVSELYKMKLKRVYLYTSDKITEEDLKNPDTLHVESIEFDCKDRSVLIKVLEQPEIVLVKSEEE